MNKKGDTKLYVIIGILVLIIIVLWSVQMSSRECNNNSECPNTHYCGADYVCHEYPDKVGYSGDSNVFAASILGICLIIAAFVFRGKKFLEFKKKKE